MQCSGVCAVCSNPCFRGEVPSRPSQEVEEKLSQFFEEPPKTENGLAVVENIGTYEVVKNIFGKEKVRKVN